MHMWLSTSYAEAYLYTTAVPCYITVWLPCLSFSDACLSQLIPVVNVGCFCQCSVASILVTLQHTVLLKKAYSFFEGQNPPCIFSLLLSCQVASLKYFLPDFRYFNTKFR